MLFRSAILQAKAEADGQHVGHDVALFIANSARSNIRELEGALLRLLALSSLQQVPLCDLTVGDAQEALHSLVRTRRRRAGIEDIQGLVCKHYGIGLDQIRGRRRTSLVAEARQVAMYLARQLTDLSLADIGGRFGKRDHSTVLHSCEKIRGQIGENAELRRFVDESLERLGGEGA